MALWHCARGPEHLRGPAPRSTQLSRQVQFWAQNTPVTRREGEECEESERTKGEAEEKGKERRVGEEKRRGGEGREKRKRREVSLP